MEKMKEGIQLTNHYSDSFMDDLLDHYNGYKEKYEETNDESYKHQMELYLGIMKASRLSFKIRQIGPEVTFDVFDN